VAFVIGILLLRVAKTPAPGVDLAELLKKNPDAYALSFGHFLDLTPQALGAFRGPLLVFVVAFLLGTSLNWVFRRKGRPRQGNVALAGMMVVMLACVHSAFVTFSPIISSQQLAAVVKNQYRPGDTIVVAGEYEDGSTLNFYTGIPLRILHEPSGNLWYGTQFPDAPRVFETQDSFVKLWTGPGRIFLWTDQDRPKELQGLPRLVLARSGGKLILTNR
jgi:hypothetical protein